MLHKDQKGGIDIIFIVAIIAVAVIGWIVFQRLDEADKTVQDTAVSNASASEQSVSSQSSQAADKAPENTESAALSAVGDYTASGDATRSYDVTTKKFMHEVTASLPELEEGKFYEGWIVGDSVVSTGKLSQEDVDRWSLTFESNTDYSTHNKVVITIETESNGLDGNPEEHILEGSFQAE